MKVNAVGSNSKGVIPQVSRSKSLTSQYMSNTSNSIDMFQKSVSFTGKSPAQLEKDMDRLIDIFTRIDYSHNKIFPSGTYTYEEVSDAVRYVSGKSLEGFRKKMIEEWHYPEKKANYHFERVKQFVEKELHNEDLSEVSAIRDQDIHDDSRERRWIRDSADFFDPIRSW